MGVSDRIVAVADGNAYFEAGLADLGVFIDWIAELMTQHAPLAAT